ncbi:hypothetical protein PIB30_018711 [Stylosanthes scabra]|uniref:Uncharacterized protein n=1 Tax=Stylosanthes scabra TaxID=79078 RepID=A0ABU6X5G9_9FABA|nr:hypothetical protein [Stylosanthes scabra]
MPIYHDYHGDAKSSSIFSWDTIQISLKCLLPSYEPVLCDSPVVSSFLSTQEICADFTQTCASIIETMNNIIREEQQNSDQQIQAKSTNPDPDPEKIIKQNSRSNAEIGKVDWNAPRLDAALETTETEAVNRPPPKSPNLPSIPVGSGTVVKAWVDGVETQTSGQDLQPLRDVDEAGTSAEVGASVRGKWTDAIATATDGGLRARWLRRFVSLTPPDV